MDKPKHCTIEEWPCGEAIVLESANRNSLELEKECKWCCFNPNREPMPWMRPIPSVVPNEGVVRGSS